MTEARAELQAALKVSTGEPIYPMVLEAMTRLRLTLGDPASAQTYAGELVQKYPANPAYRRLIAETFAQQRRLTRRRHKSSLPDGWRRTIPSPIST